MAKQRFHKPELRPQVTTLWEYPSQHYGAEEQGSKTYKGATPSFVIWNVLHRFSQPGEIVIDPFCGSGTTLDVCRDLGRIGLGFDVAPARGDVKNADARSLPLKNASADLCFMDPPYADNIDYSDDPRCIGKLKADGRYQRAMRMAIKEVHRVLRPEKAMAIYVCDIFKKGRGERAQRVGEALPHSSPKKSSFHPLGFELFSIAKEEGFEPIDIVCVVRHNKTLDMGNYRKAADEGGFFLRGFNYLLLLRKLSSKNG